MAQKSKQSDAASKQTKQVEELQDFLTHYGYLNPKSSAAEGMTLPPEPPNSDLSSYADVTTTKKGKMDAPTVEALKNYQEFHGLNCSGKIDKHTIKCMQTKRCGLPDLGEFNADGRKWSSTNLTYGFLNYSPDLNQAQTEQAIAQAFALWAAETPLRFTKINNANSADIRIRFVAGDHGDGSSFDGAGGVLAHAFYPPPNGGALAGDAHFDEAEKWTINVPTGGGKFDLVTVAAHEFGHSLGLRHSNVNGSLMFPSYSGPQRFLHSDDTNGIRSIYGFYNIAQASWVHGTSIQIEYPERMELVRRAGFYTYLVGKPNTTNWFHFAVPTPVIVNNVRLKIAAAILRFRTLSPNAIVKHIHIYDGYTKIASHNNVNLTGNQWFRKYGVAHKPSIFWGFGISIGVEFKGGNATNRRMDFVSAGADFIK